METTLIAMEGERENPNSGEMDEGQESNSNHLGKRAEEKKTPEI